MTRFENPEKNEAIKEGLPLIEEWYKKNLNGADFLSGGSQPMMIDVTTFSLVERMVMLENSPWSNGFELMDVKKNAPTVYAYVHRFRAHP